MNTVTSIKLSERAVLVYLRCSQWGGQRKDREATYEYCNEMRVQHDRVSVVKRLMPEELLPIHSATRSARAAHRKMTVPWFDDGARMLPSIMTMEYIDTMRGLISTVDARVEELVSNWGTAIESERRRQNGLFKETDYPTKEQLRALFSIRYSFRPIPTSTDFRVEIDEEYATSIREEIDRSVHQALEEATRELWQRLYEPVKHMADILSNEDGRVHQTLFEKVSDIVELLPKLNLTQDPELDRMTEEVAKRLCNINPKYVRASKLFRNKVADEAKRMADLISSAMGGVQ